MNEKGKVSLIVPVLTAKVPRQLRYFRLQRKSFCLETSFYFHHGLITAENMSLLETSCLCACGTSQLGICASGEQQRSGFADLGHCLSSLTRFVWSFSPT